LSEPGFYDRLAEQSKKLVQGLTERAGSAGVPFAADSIGGMFGLYFSLEVPTSFEEVSAADGDLFRRFFHEMLERGVYFAPSAFEAGFVSSTHDDEVIQATLDAAEIAFSRLV